MATEIIKLDRGQPDPAGIEYAASVVRAGGLVGFPTETVYGIACRVNRSSLSRLDAVKGRTADKRYTLHIADKTELAGYVPRLGLKAGKLVAGVWPGPVTIVFELGPADLDQQRKNLPSEVFENLYAGNTIGIRLPADPVAIGLVKAAGVPVVAPSANKTGQAPSTEAAQVAEQFSDELDLILDGGPTRYKTSSTVVRAGPRGVQVLRPGVITDRQLASIAQISFLFVCTGNTCRSPMAAGLFRKYLAEKLCCPVDQLEEIGYKILSAGIMDLTGLPASSEAVNACIAKGVDIKAHRSCALTSELAETADIIFGMCKVHCQQVEALSARTAQKCHLLAGDAEIADPIGQGRREYEQSADAIEQAVRKRVDELVL